VTGRGERLLPWAGLLAAPLAWAFYLVAGYGLEEVDCSRGSMHWGLDGRAWEAAVTIVAASVALAGLAAAAWTRRRAERGSDPRGRLGFLSTWGLLGSPLFLLVIVVGGIGVLTLDPCARG
jgi:hypothetical protein